jgi:hypothetical protein
LGRLDQLHASWRDRVDFFCVYIQEAHPEDGWQVDQNVAEGVIFDQPATADDRAQIARTCVLRTAFSVPMLLDSMDNSIDRRFAALPERLYLIDAEGRVAWKSVMGSGGFDVDALAHALEQLAGPAAASAGARSG